jgi:peroxiredoxin
VIDKKGIIRKIYGKVDLKKHPDEVLTYVQATLADKK